MSLEPPQSAATFASTTDTAASVQADVDAKKPEASVASRVARGSAATLIAHVSSNAIRLGSNLILTRLLAPEHFGMMMLASVILQGLHMFSDLGIGPSLVQHEDGERRDFVHTAFTIQVMRGGWLFLASLLLAWPVARFYEMEWLLWMVPVAGLTSLVEGFTSTKVFRVNRQLSLGRLSTIEVSTQLVAATTMVVLAYYTSSVVSLLIGSFVGAVLRALLSHVALPGFADGFAWAPRARHELITFGRWIFVSTAITFVAMQLDRLLLGRLAHADALGIYSLAAMLAAVPREVFGAINQRVIYPWVAELIRTGAPGEKIKQMRLSILQLLLIPIAVLAGESEAVFRVLYDDRYQTGGPLMAFLCLGTWINVLGSTYGVVVLSKGWPKWISFGTGAKALLAGALLIPVYNLWGLPGAALLVAVTEVAVALFTGAGCRGTGVTTYARDIGFTFAVVVGAVLVHVVQVEISARTGTPWVGLIGFGMLAAGAALLGVRRVMALARH